MTGNGQVSQDCSWVPGDGVGGCCLGAVSALGAMIFLVLSGAFMLGFWTA